MNKKTKYAINGALWLGLGNAALNAIKQLTQMDNDPKKEFDWHALLGAAGKGAIVGGAGGLAIGAYTDYQNSQEKSLDTDAFLFAVLEM